MATPSMRDAGLRRLTATTRMLAVGSVAAAGLLSLLVVRAHPGSSRPPARLDTLPPAAVRTGTRPGIPAAPRPATRPAEPGPGSASSLAPSPPPVATTRPPVASSGAS